MGASLLAKTIREQARSHSGSRFAVATRGARQRLQRRLGSSGLEELAQNRPALFSQHPAFEQDTVIEKALGKKLPLTLHNPGLGLMWRTSKQCR